MSDISLTVITATAGSADFELAFSTTIPDFVLGPEETYKIALSSNKFNVNYSVNLITGSFTGTTNIVDYGYTTALESSVIKVLEITAPVGFSDTASFSITATSGDQTAESNVFTISSSGSPVTKNIVIDANASTLTGFDNSLGNLEVVVKRTSEAEVSVQGQESYTTSGSYVFTVPDGVTQVSAVAIGGGAGGGIGGGAGGNLAYNTFSVTPGETLNVVVGAGGAGIGQQAKGQSSVTVVPQDGGASYIDTPNGCKVYAPGGRRASQIPTSSETGNPWFRATNTDSQSYHTALEFAEAQTSQTLHLGGSGGWYSPFINYGTISSGNTNWRNGDIEYSSAGGGAAGYLDDGGDGAPHGAVIGRNGREDGWAGGNTSRVPTVVSSRAGGGGAHTRDDLLVPYNGAGGGVGITGQNTTGLGGEAFQRYVDNQADPMQNGTPGGGGINNAVSSVGSPSAGRGGSYGGGGAGASSYELTWNGTNNFDQTGGPGAVKIIWGEGRSYPITNTGDVETITADDLSAVQGIINDSPAFKYTLVNPLNTTLIPRSTTAGQFKKARDNFIINIPIEDDSIGTEGTNIGSFDLQISDPTDGYQFGGATSISLEVSPNPNPRQREVSIDMPTTSLTIDQGENFSITVTRISTRNGEDDFSEKVDLLWSITTTDEKFIETTGLAEIKAGENSTTFLIPTSADYSTSGEQGTGVFSLTSAVGSLYGEYDIVDNTLNLNINDVYKLVEILSPSENVIDITEGQTKDITISSLYELNGVPQFPENVDVSYSLTNKDSRITNTNSTVTLQTTGGLGKVGIVTINTITVLGIQSSVDTIFRLTSVTNNYVIGANLSKILNVIDSSNIVKNISISTNNITADEGDDIVITIQRVSTADGLDNYDDGGVIVPWRIIGTDTRYSLTSGVIVFSTGETEKILTIPTTDDNVGNLNTQSTFEIYEPTNGYSIVNDASSININLIDYDPIYLITENKTFLNEEESIVFDIETQRVNNGTTLYAYLNLEGATLEDFSGSVYTRDISGSGAPVTITNNAGSYSVTLAADAVSESAETFKLELWSDIAPNGNLLASSSVIPMSDSFYTISTDKDNYNSGETILIDISADLNNGNTKQFTITGVDESDIASISGPGFVSGSWSGNTYTGTLSFSRVINVPLQQVYGGTNNQTWNFIVPNDISSISSVAVGAGGGGIGLDRLRGGGGGALAYSNNIPVTPGETLTAEVVDGDMFLKRENGTVILKAEGGGRGSSNSGGQASNSIGDTKSSGGNGSTYQLVYYINSRVSAGGGGAAGYTGNGNSGDGGAQGYTGVTSNTTFKRRGGGGIGLKGTSVGTRSQDTGRGAYGGGDGGGWNNLSGGNYGGGGGAGTQSNASTGQGYNGSSGSAGLRIIWGSGRSYPSNADDAFGPGDEAATASIEIEVTGSEKNIFFTVDSTTIKSATIT